MGNKESSLNLSENLALLLDSVHQLPLCNLKPTLHIMLQLIYHYIIVTSYYAKHLASSESIILSPLSAF